MRSTVAALLALLLPLAVLTGAGEASGKIDWHSYEAGMARSQFEKKRVFLHFSAEWCGYCREMDRKTFQDPAIVAALNRDFIAIRVDYDREPATSALYKVQGLPDSWFLSERGEPLGHRPGFISPEQFRLILKVVMAGGANP
jgi:thiol:disulfide interchange protein DsbD